MNKKRLSIDYTFLGRCIAIGILITYFDVDAGYGRNGFRGSNAYYSEYSSNAGNSRYPRKAGNCRCHIKNGSSYQNFSSTSNQASRYGNSYGAVRNNYVVRRGAQRFEGFYFGLGTHLIHRNFKVEASDNLISEVYADTWNSKDLNNSRFLDSKFTRIGVTPVIGYSFIVKNVILLGFEAFCDLSLGNSKESSKFTRILKGKNENLTADTFTIYKTKFEAARFIPGVAFIAGKYFKGISSCLYGRLGVTFPKDTITVDVENELTLPERSNKFKWNRLGCSFGIGLQRMLSCKPFQKDISLRFEVGRVVQQSQNKTYSVPVSDDETNSPLQIKTKLKVGGARYFLKFYGVIHP